MVTNDEANMIQSNLGNGVPFLNRPFKRSCCSTVLSFFFLFDNLIVNQTNPAFRV